MGRHHLRADEVTMADVFAGSGYRTGVFGKWHLGDNYPFRPQDRGFHESLTHGGGVVGEAPDFWGNDNTDDTYFRNGKPEKTTGYCTDVWFREAMAFIDKAKQRPFFVYLPTNAPHGPHHVPLRYTTPYLDRKGVSASRARFYGMIANIDDNLGRLRTFLRDKGLTRNTILVFMTDNGTAGGVGLRGVKGPDPKHGFPANGFNAGMRGKKGSAYEGGHRAACFMHWPAGRLDRPRDVRPITADIDLLPTLIDLCRLKAPKGVAFDGRDLAPLLRGGKAPWPARTLCVHNQARFGQAVKDDRPIKYKDFAVMTDRWRLVGEELYDVQADPGQRKNVADQNPDVVSELKKAYEAWWVGISGRFNEYSRTVVGSPKQSQTMLTCQGWHGDRAPYSQQHVRSAMQANGFWDLTVAKAGTYRITLRRWPVELDLAIDAVVPPLPLNPARHDENYKLLKLPSRAITPTRARLKVGRFDETRPVKAGQKAVTFDVALAAGSVDLQTWLIEKDGTSRGAYYVYIQRLNEGPPHTVEIDMR